MPRATPSQADNQPTDSQAVNPAPERPLDPRRAPDVLFALEQAARRDPHPDPLKPIGRSSFLIWAAIVVTLFFAAGPAHKYVDYPKFRTEVLMAYHTLIDSHPNPPRALKEIKRSPHKMEILAVTGFAAGTLLFALYYVAIYLIGMNMRRMAADAATAMNAGARQLAAWRQQLRAKPRGSNRVIIEQTTAAGPEPTLH